MKFLFLLALGLSLANGQASQTHASNPIPGSSPRSHHTLHVQRTRSLPSSSTLSDFREESINLLQTLSNKGANHAQQNRETSSDSSYSDDSDLDGEFVVSVFSKSGKAIQIATISISDSEENQPLSPPSQEQNTQALMAQNQNMSFLDQVKSFERAFGLFLIRSGDPIALLKSSASQPSFSTERFSEDKLSQETKIAVSYARSILVHCLLNQIKDSIGPSITIQGENLIKQILNWIEPLTSPEAGPLLNPVSIIFINGQQIQVFNPGDDHCLTFSIQ